MGRKVKLSIEENLRYQREVIITMPEGVVEDEILNKHLDVAQRGADSADDILCELQRMGYSYETYDSSLDSPDFSEAECDDYEFIDDED